MTAGLWESERQRSALYVERRRRERRALQDAVFRRINAHVQYMDHVHARRRQAQEEEDEEAAHAHEEGEEAGEGEHGEDLALDFLGDVDADDMRSLLVGATSSSTPPTEPAPLAMPTHLLSTASALSVMTTTVAGVAVGVSLGEDVGVSELMDELQIDVRTLVTSPPKKKRQQEGKEEGKTEESTPPRHVREQRVQSAREKAGKPRIPPPPLKSMEAQWREVVDPEAAAANEMVGWVAGRNDPEVIKRRESLRGEKRRETKRLGTNAYSEQVSIRPIAKFQAGEGGSSSSSSEEKSDSDFSLQEVIEVEDDEEADEPFSDSELLPDDYIAEDDDGDDKAERRKKANARRRIRQRPRTKMTIRKMTTTTKTASTRETAPTPKRKKDETPETPREPKQVAEVAQQEPEEEKEPQMIDLRSDSETEPAADTHVDTGIEHHDEDDHASDAPPATPPPSTPLILKLKVSHLDLRKLKEMEEEQRPLSVHETPERPAPDATAGVMAVEQDPLPSVESTEQSSTPSKSRFAFEDEEADDGYGTDVIEDQVEDAEDIREQVDAGDDVSGEDSDTGTIELENEELEEPEQPQAEDSTALSASQGSPSSSSSGILSDESNKLNPVEPQVKMSPQHPTPPSNARALNAESPTAKVVVVVDEEQVPEPEAVGFEEVGSELDFGSGESEDFGGRVDLRIGRSASVDEDDEDAEFGQFFGPQKKKQRVSVAPQEAKNVQVADASPVKKIHLQGDPASSSPSPANKGAASMATAEPSPPITKGSNGLRTVPNINTTTVAKGKFQHTRRAIRLLDEDMKPTGAISDGDLDDPKRKLLARSRFIGSVGPPSSGEVSPRTIRPLQLRRTTSDGAEAAKNSRYLGYEKPAPKPSPKEQFMLAAKNARERYDKTAPKAPLSAMHTSTAASYQIEKPTLVFDSSAIGTCAGILKPLARNSKATYFPPRDPQIDIYQATGAVSQFDDDEPLSRMANHKRPTKFVKDVEEAKRNGINVKKGIPLELDPKAKIPKKSSRQLASERSAGGDRGKPATSPPSKRAKKSHKGKDSGRPSIYGPQTGDKPFGPSDSGRRRNDESSNEKNARSSHSSSNSKNGHYSPPQRSRDKDRDYERDRERGSRRDGGRGRDREYESRTPRERDNGSSRSKRSSRSRSPVDRYRDQRRRSHSPTSSKRVSSYRSSHEHDDRIFQNYRRSRSRSTSPSRSRSKDNKRDRDDRDRDRRRSAEPQASSRGDARESASYKRAEDLAQTMKERSERPDTDSARKSIKPPSFSGASSIKTISFDDDNDSNIADSDFEIVDELGDDAADDDEDAPYDIRYRFDDIHVDHALRKKVVYVCNLPPQVDELALEEIFAPYEIAEDPKTGFPAVEVFLSQRTLRPRGDARVTFVSAEAAARAAEEVDAIIFANSRLTVRPMDRETMRILMAQFDTPRDTWTCPTESCHAENSKWAGSCSQCRRRRLFPPGNVKIELSDELCKLCFTTVAHLATRCSGCSSQVAPLFTTQEPYRPSSSRERDNSRRY